MPRPRALAVAVASCAAAALPGSSASTQPASVQAVAQLGRHAAGDARSAVATAGSSPRRAQRLLARSGRRLRYAHTLAALVRVDQAAASAQAAAPLAEDSAEVARNAADLARWRRGRLEGLAVKTLRQAADLQDQTALALACSRFPGSLTQLRHVLDTAVDAQDQLLTALSSVSDCEQVSSRRRRASRAALAPAQDARDALVAALTQIRIALSADVLEPATTNGAATHRFEAAEKPAPHDDDTADPDIDDPGH